MGPSAAARSLVDAASGMMPRIVFPFSCPHRAVDIRRFMAEV